MLAPRARAEEPLQLPEITVEDSRLDRYLPARTVIDRPELVVDSTAQRAQRGTDLTPGLNVREGGRGETRLDMRGFDQRAVLFTLDGVPVYEPYNGIVNLDLFPLEMLQRVEITRGAVSTLFGPNGMAGTVKLQTYIPDAPLVGSLSTLWHYSNTWDSRASVGGSQGRFSGFLGGRYLTSPGFPLSDGFDDRPATRQRFENGGTRLNSDQDEKSAFASLKVALPNDGEVHAAFLGSRAEFGIPPSTTGFAPVFLRNDHQELGHLQAGLDQRLAPSVGVDAAVFYSTYSSKESQFDGLRLRPQAPQYDRGQRRGGRHRANRVRPRGARHPDPGRPGTPRPGRHLGHRERHAGQAGRHDRERGVGERLSCSRSR